MAEQQGRRVTAITDPAVLENIRTWAILDSELDQLQAAISSLKDRIIAAGVTERGVYEAPNGLSIRVKVPERFDPAKARDRLTEEQWAKIQKTGPDAKAARDQLGAGSDVYLSCLSPGRPQIELVV